MNGQVLKASLSPAHANRLRTLQGSILSQHHHDPNSTHTNKIPIGHVLLDQKPMREDAHIVVEINTPKIRVFSHTYTQNGGMNLKEERSNKAMQQLLLIWIQTH